MGGPWEDYQAKAGTPWEDYSSIPSVDVSLKPSLDNFLKDHSNPQHAADKLRRAIANGIVLDMPLSRSYEFEEQITKAMDARGVRPDMRGVSTQKLYHPDQQRAALMMKDKITPVTPERIAAGIPEFGKGVAAGGIQTVASSLSGLDWIMDDVPGLGWLANLSRTGADWLKERAQDINVNPRFASDLGSGVGSMGTFLIPGTIVARGTTKIASAAPSLANWLGVSTMSSLEALSEAGSVFDSKVELTERQNRESSGLPAKDPRDEAAKAARITFWSNIPLLMVTNKLGLFAENGTRVSKALKSAAMEGPLQEGPQYAISTAAVNDPNKAFSWDEFWYQSAIGGIVGSGASVVLNALNDATSKARKAEQQMPLDVKAVYEGTVSGLVAKGVDPEAAHIEATRAISKMESGQKYIDQVGEAAESAMVIEATLEKMQKEALNPAQAEAQAKAREERELNAFVDTLITTEETDTQVDDAALDVLFDRMTESEEAQKGIKRYSNNDVVGTISPQTAVEINALGFQTQEGDTVIPQKTIDYIAKKRPWMTKDDIDTLKETVESPDEILPNIATAKSPYRSKSVLLVKQADAGYVAVVEITVGKDKNVLWNFWTDEKSTIERYLRKFREQKTRLLQTGGATVPSYSSQLDASTEAGKPESLSGSQSDLTGSEDSIPLPETGVKGDTLLEAAAEEEIQDKAQKVKDILLNENGSVDIDSLIDLGNAVWSAGETTHQTFTAKMKETLGEVWQKVKGFIKQVWESVKAFNEQLGERGSIGRPEDVTRYEKMKEVGPKSATKTVIREETGQTRQEIMVSETQALKAAFKKASQAAKIAYREGNQAGVEAQKAIMKEALQQARGQAIEQIEKIKTDKQKMDARRRKIRDIRDTLGLNDNDLRKITKSNPVLMTDAEFKGFADKVYQRAVELADKAQAKAELMDVIYIRRLQKIDNYRNALDLPSIDKMTTQQLYQFAELLEPFQVGDVFLGERELETVDRTDLKGIRTWREAKEALAKELGVSIAELNTIHVSEFDNYRWDTALAERNPFYKMMVTETTASLLEAEGRPSRRGVD